MDFINKSSGPKFTVVQNHQDGPYDVRKDFYKKFRDAVKKMHKKDLGIEYLEAEYNRLTDPKKTKHYAELNKGYKKWLKGRELKWFAPQGAICDLVGLEITVNPELGLEIDGYPYIIKMYLKDDGLRQRNADLIISLMEIACQDNIPENCKMAVMDVRKGKIFQHSGKNTKRLMLQLEAEAEYWQKISEEL